jgi:hypothetical protein
VVDEGSHRVGQDTASANAAELLFQAITHSCATAGGNDNGGKSARWRVCGGSGRHDPVITIGRGKVYDNSGHAGRCDRRPDCPGRDAAPPAVRKGWKSCLDLVHIA